MGVRRRLVVPGLMLVLGTLPLIAADPATKPATQSAALAELTGLPAGKTWGGGSFQPRGSNTVFASGDGCALCHSASPRATALMSATGDDVSPHGLWEGTLMANAGRDPFFFAQLAKEGTLYPQKAEALTQTCVRCHAPTAHHSYRIANQPLPALSDLRHHPLYGDGVSCTVCHQIQPDGLGTEATYDGQPVIKPERTIFGPFADPGATPMIVHSAFTPKQGSHIQTSAMCASCHTLRTEHGGGGAFTEQSAYFEWRNSDFSDEPPPNGQGRTSQSLTCQECHMPDVGPMRIARNPAGLDFNIQTRAQVRGHAFVGGNALMLDLLREYAAELGVTAPAETLERLARATRTQLGHRTASVAAESLTRVKNDDGTESLSFDVVVRNLAGHKFPTGYPSRRAWLNVEVRAGRSVIFESGEPDASGRIKGVEPTTEVGVPHVDLVTLPTQVPIYEQVAADVDGKPTLNLSEMATRLKDNRLLPSGYKADGPHASEIAPVGIGADANFVGGSDRVSYRVPLPADASGRLVVVVRMYYQTIPPVWVDALRDVDHADTKAFARMYDSAKTKTELVGTAVGTME